MDQTVQTSVQTSVLNQLTHGVMSLECSSHSNDITPCQLVCNTLCDGVGVLYNINSD